MQPIHWSLVAFVVVVAAACAEKPGAPPPDGGGLADAERPGDTEPTDECGNGMDDNGNGLIDEGCPCGPEETQSCFTGNHSTRGVGVCSDGSQRCVVEGSMEWGSWGACEGDAAPQAEICDGALDDDCNGAIDDGCPCTAGESRGCGLEFTVAPCTGGVQTCREDGSWTGCEGAITPEPETCGADGLGDGIDNDCDGEMDELCGCMPEPELCDDGVDNDCDGEVDELCACVAEPEVCGDGVDNDCDGEVDETGCLDDMCPVRHTGIVEIEGSGQTSCARHGDGRVFCWGNNIQGALGIGEEFLEYSHTPREVIDNAVSFDTGRGTMACVMRGDGSSWCWGRQPLGGGGPGSYRDVALSPFSPPQAARVTDVTQMVVGADYQLMRTSDGSLWGWGFDGGGSYALGDGMVDSTYAPLAVRAHIDDVVDVDSFLRSVCAVRADGTVWCWGAGQRGIAGPPGGRTHWVLSPVQIAGVEGAVSVAVTGSSACALLASGEVSCWGADGFRGDGSTSGEGARYTTAGAVIPRFSGVYRLEAGEWGICAFRGDGELWCWGSNNFAATPEYASPQRMADVGPVEDVIVGELPMVIPINGRFVGEMCVLERCGRVRCWGRNRDGQVGDGTIIERQTPVDVVALP